MYSGFVTPKRVVKRVGIHQRFDRAAYRMIRPYLPERGFPTLKAILSFEGYNGPDGLKVKSPGQAEPSHLYDPATDTGEVPMHIASHYAGLVEALKAGDTVRGAFEAAWMAHYVCDGLTPAHHWPLEERLAEAAATERDAVEAGDIGELMARAKKHWAVWGVKGHLSTHFTFEVGIAFALIAFPIKSIFHVEKLARARKLGPVDYFKEQARDIATLNLYERFYKQGWNNDIALLVKNNVAPVAIGTIGLLWLLAILEASRDEALMQIASLEDQ